MSVSVCPVSAMLIFHCEDTGAAHPEHVTQLPKLMVLVLMVLDELVRLDDDGQAKNGPLGVNVMVPILQHSVAEIRKTTHTPSSQSMMI